MSLRRPPLPRRLRKAGFEGALAAAQRLSGRRAFLTSYPIDLQPRWGWGRPPNAACEQLLARDRDAFEQARKSVGAHLDFFASIPARGAPTTLHWENDFWGALDAGFQCTALIDRAPANYVEVGSGYSTMFARHAIERHGLGTRITSIDPAPRAEVDALCDRVLRCPVQQVEPDVFTSLAPGDVVLFDGSHEAYTAADTVVMLLEILPALPAGVLVGVDDVFLPWDYPAEWTGRLYAEQYLLAAYLLGGGAEDCVVLPAFYLTSGDEETHPFDACAPRLGSFGKSFWLQR